MPTHVSLEDELREKISFLKGHRTYWESNRERAENELAKIESKLSVLESQRDKL